MELDIATAGLVVGFVIGLTGMGGGALMTPMLVLLFNVNPTAAISSDVVASFFLKPVGGGVHIRRGTVNWRLVRWLCLGSVPSAFAGAYLVSRIGGPGFEDRVKHLLGAVLLVAATAMLVKTLVQARRRSSPDAPMDRALVRPIPTLVVGTLGGLVVGMTSVGSGSLMIVSLMLMYPLLSSREMVGTDLVQAVPLVGAAALGHVVFGDLRLDLMTSVLLGALPGVYLGARVSSRASDRYIRPVLVAVLTVSSVKLLGASNAISVGVLVALVVLFATTALVLRRRRAVEERERELALAPS